MDHLKNSLQSHCEEDLNDSLHLATIASTISKSVCDKPKLSIPIWGNIIPMTISNTVYTPGLTSKTDQHAATFWGKSQTINGF